MFKINIKDTGTTTINDFEQAELFLLLTLNIKLFAGVHYLNYWLVLTNSFYFIVLTNSLLVEKVLASNYLFKVMIETLGKGVKYIQS